MNASALARIRINGEGGLAWSQRQPDHRDQRVDGEIVELPVIAAGQVSRSSDDFTLASSGDYRVSLPGRRAIAHNERNATGKIGSPIVGDGETALDPAGISASVVALPP